MQALKSKTIWAAVVIAVLSVLQGYVFLLPVSPLQQMIIGLVIAVTVAGLRMVTTQSISEK